MSAAERVLSALPEGIATEVGTRDGMATLAVPPEGLRPCFEALKHELGFESNTLVTALDHHPRSPRYELCWQFLSLQHNERVRITCRVGGDDPSVPTLSDLWPGASFSERETYDMFGIRFEGHPDLRRLLMPQGYDHFPLRKDFPHHGIEPDRLYREWEESRPRP